MFDRFLDRIRVLLERLSNIDEAEQAAIQAKAEEAWAAFEAGKYIKASAAALGAMLLFRKAMAS